VIVVFAKSLGPGGSTEDAMRVSFLVVALTIAGLFSAAAQGAPLGEESFVGRIDLRIGIAQLAELARNGDVQALARMSGDRALLLFGTLSRPVVTSEAPFEAATEFLEGEWVGTSKLLLHRVFLVFKGEEYREFLDGSSGKRTVVIARNPTLRSSPEGSRDVSLEVVSVRPIY
jgi:hypothetical protein